MAGNSLDTVLHASNSPKPRLFTTQSIRSPHGKPPLIAVKTSFVQDTQPHLVGGGGGGDGEGAGFDIGGGGGGDGEGAGFDIGGEEGSVHLPPIQIPKGTE